MPSTRETAIIQLESCITEIRAWMSTNKLKLNDDKTKFLLFLPNHSTPRALNDSQTIHIGSDQVTLGTQAKNLDVILDSALSG